MKKILLISLFFLCHISFCATYTSSTTGSWTTNSTWVGGTKPTLVGGGGQLSDDVIIESGHTVTLNGNLTVKSGVTLRVKGTLIIQATGDVDFQNGSIIIVETGGTLEMDMLTNSNNSTNVTIHGTLIVNGDYMAGTGASLSGNGDMTVTGTSSGNGTTFGTTLTCSDCIIDGTGNIENSIINGSQTNQSAPIEPYYRYTYSQQIYYQSEIDQEGNINGLSFEYNGYTSTVFDVEVYLGHTTKTSFSSSTNWVSYSDLIKVYDGNYSVSNSAGWYSITFDTPFYYNNSDNLVIAVKEKTSAYQSSSTEFYTADGVVYRVLTYYDDVTIPNPASPPTADYRSKWLPSLKLSISNVATPLPIQLLSFKGKVIEPIENQINVLLDWVTASEQNNDYFTIRRSMNGYDWDIIGIVKGSGNNSTILEYFYVDRKPESGINYYNLSQTDFDGETEFFDIISVNVENLSGRKYVKYRYNLLGQIVNEDYKGNVILIWDNGYVEKRFQ